MPYTNWEPEMPNMYYHSFPEAQATVAFVYGGMVLKVSRLRRLHDDALFPFPATKSHLNANPRLSIWQGMNLNVNKGNLKRKTFVPFL